MKSALYLTAFLLVATPSIWGGPERQTFEPEFDAKSSKSVEMMLFEKAANQSEPKDSKLDRKLRLGIIIGAPIIGGAIGYFALGSNSGSTRGVGQFFGAVGGALVGVWIALPIAMGG